MSFGLIQSGSGETGNAVSSFLPIVEEHEVQPYEHEGDAEPLPHVECHALLEVHLVLLQELDEEAEGEYLRQAQAEVEASVVAGRQGLPLLKSVRGFCSIGCFFLLYNHTMMRKNTK